MSLPDLIDIATILEAMNRIVGTFPDIVIHEARKKSQRLLPNLSSSCVPQRVKMISMLESDILRKGRLIRWAHPLTFLSGRQVPPRAPRALYTESPGVSSPLGRPRTSVHSSINFSATKAPAVLRTFQDRQSPYWTQVNLNSQNETHPLLGEVAKEASKVRTCPIMSAKRIPPVRD